MEPVDSSKSWVDRLRDWARRSVMLKLFSVAVMVLLLLIPSALIQDLVRERAGRRNEAVRDVSGKWGAEQTVSGLVLTVPYRYPRTVEADGKLVRSSERGYAHLLPDTLVVRTEVQSELRARGIFEVPLYEVAADIRTTFTPPAANLPPLPEGAEVLWDEAWLEAGISDIRGITAADSVRVNGAAYRFAPSLPVKEVFPSGIHALVPLAGTAPLEVQARLRLRGSQGLWFLPLGRVTQVHVRGSGGAGTPSFDGAFLPGTRQLDASGFAATWQVLDLNRDLPPHWTDRLDRMPTAVTRYAVPDAEADYASGDNRQMPGAQSAFGLRLLPGVDTYQQTERSAKYDVLFIFLTFLVLFFAEVLGERRVHPVQYLLIGFTIVVFYVLLLALSEHMPFSVAYLLGAAAITAYVVLYARSAFGNRRLTGVLLLLMALLYGFFYSLLQLEDYALLVGSIGLLALVGVILYVTRQVDWYRYGLPDAD